MFVNAHARGQTLVETILALPIVLLAIFGILYVAQLGVVNERAQLALRYGGIAEFNTSQSVYSAANIYQNLAATGFPSPCPSPPVGVFSNSAPFPGPTSAPFWQPSADGQPVSTCAAGAYGFGGSQFLATHYLAETTLSVSAGVDVPNFLRPVLGGSSIATTTAVASFVHAASPGMILYCSKEVHDRVWGAITAESTTQTPPPGPTNNGGCR